VIPDSDRPYSPGWYFKQLFNELSDRKRQQRLELLNNYMIGEARLPRGAERAREAYEAFMRLARSNFARLVVSALAQRMRLSGFRSATEMDETGDPELGSLWQRAGMNVVAADVHKAMLGLAEAYVVVGEVDADTDAAVVTYEDPRWVVGMPDPDNGRRLIAALKIKYDPAADVDRIYLYFAGKVFAPGANAQIWVAERKATGRLGPMMGFDYRDWTWMPARSGALRHDRCPVVRFDNADNMGEFEAHIDILDRINHQILQRMTIAVMQAFRQRAVRGLPSVYPAGHPKAGQDIDYGDVFVSDPAAVWHLPPGAEMWESGTIDVTPLLTAVKDDVTHLAVVTETPLYYLMPAGENQSAEGAVAQRENLVFKARDRIERADPKWIDTVALMLLQAGATDRQTLSRLGTIWASPEMLSLSERADAAAKAANDIPRRSRLQLIWQFDPPTVDRLMTEWADEMVLQQALANALAAANPVQVPLSGQPALPGQPSRAQQLAQQGADNTGPGQVGGQQGRQLAIPAGQTA
jgi:hypothetical protein